MQHTDSESPAVTRSTVRRAHRAYAVSALLLGVLTGCSEPESARVPLPATDAWLGRWIGPEGTYLQIDGGGGRYEITVADLDGPRSFQAQAQAASIVFERDGRQEVVRATDGVGTGMKWLAGQTNCLVIKVGEGFCRP